jgi:3-oxoacyl-[acyl-carrier protein] reductase
MDFEKIYVGQKASLRKKVLAEDVEAFAKFSGDYNPLHMDESFARTTPFQKRVAHGMVVASYVSTLVGMELPGPGSLWNQQSFDWRAPVFIGDDLEISVEVTHKSEGTRCLTIEVRAVNQNRITVLEGKGVVMTMEQREKQQEKLLGERVAMVTGASRGIGAAIAKALARAGASVVINHRNSAAQAGRVADEIQAAGGKAAVLQTDVTDSEAVNDAFKKVFELFGKPVDVLVNNASGSINPRPFEETTWEDIQAHLAVQLHGAYSCCKAALPGMLKQKSGRIINIGSIFTWAVPPPNLTSYVLAKAALKALTRSMAAELGPRGIRVNMVSPGMTETELIADMPERLRKVQAMQTPLRRLCTPEDVARTVVFLSSEAGEFFAGADVPVCGGVAM